MDEEGKEIYINNLEKKYSDSILDIDYKKKGESIVLNVYSGNDWYVTEDRREFYMKINPKRTFFPSFLYFNASFPIVVVFPTPFTPTIKITFILLSFK